MEGLGHGAEVFPQACRLTARDGQSAKHGLFVQAHEFAGRTGAGEGATGGRRVKTSLIVARVNGLRDLALNLHTELIGQKDICTRCIQSLALGNGRWQSGRGGVSQQTIDTVFGDGELCVVIVVCVNANAVGEGCESGGGLDVGSEHRG